jgi:hypothetical protein
MGRAPVAENAVVQVRPNVNDKFVRPILLLFNRGLGSAKWKWIAELALGASRERRRQAAHNWGKKYFQKVENFEGRKRCL